MEFGGEHNTKDEVDPAADFLAREQTVLGDLEAEIIQSSANHALATDSVASFEDTLLVGGNGNSELGNELAQAVGGFESLTGAQPSREEPEKIKKWREEQKHRLEEKDRAEEIKKEELRLQAKQELDDWMCQITESIAKTKLASRNAEKQAATLENGSVEPGTEWERIAKLCDFNPKLNKSGKDVARMRSIYLHLKQNPISIQKSA